MELGPSVALAAARGAPAAGCAEACSPGARPFVAAVARGGMPGACPDRPPGIGCSSLYSAGQAAVRACAWPPSWVPQTEKTGHTTAIGPRLGVLSSARALPGLKAIEGFSAAHVQLYLT